MVSHKSKNNGRNLGIENWFGLVFRAIIVSMLISCIFSSYYWICMTAAILLHLYALQCCCLVLHTRVSIPMFIAVSLFFLPFLFYCCTSSPYLRCVPINPLSDFFSTNKKRGRCNLFTCHSFSLLFNFYLLDYNALNHADIF